MLMENRQSAKNSRQLRRRRLRILLVSPLLVWVMIRVWGRHRCPSEGWR